MKPVVQLALMGALLFSMGGVSLPLAGIFSGSETTPPASASGAPPAPATTNATTAKTAEQFFNSGDKVHYFIEEDPVRGSGPIELMVSPLGDLSFPVSRNSDLLVVINTRGKGLPEIKTELKTKLDADYYHNATVYLKPHDQGQRRAQVLFSGEVRNNVLIFGSSEPVTLFEAVVKQGYTDFANLKKVRVHRTDSVTKKTETMIFDVNAMLKGDRSKDIPLKDGDHVEVPAKTLVF